MLSAFHEVVTGRAPDMLRAYLLAVVIQMVAVNLLGHYGYLQTTIQPFFGVVTVAGGFVFGLGMILAIGCAGAVLYRAGEGKLDYLLVMIAYAVGAWASNNWVVSPLRHILRGEGRVLTLPGMLPVSRWLVIAVAAFGIILWVLRGKRRSYHGGWDWSLTGLLLGLIGVAAWAASAITGRPAGLGTVNVSHGLAGFFLKGDVSGLNWSLFLVVGIPLGSLIASRLHGRSPAGPVRFARIPQALAGGLLMGLGATLVEGDNMLHGLSGVPLLAMSSLTFMLCIFLSTWVGVKLGWLAK